MYVCSPGACTLEIALKYKVKQSKNGKFPSNYRASPIYFPSIDKPLRIKAPQKIRAFEKYKPRSLFSEFYGVLPKTCPALKLRSGSAFTSLGK